MWRNYVTVGVRALAKNRAYAVINILGLAIGMAACLTILLFVRYELGYDSRLERAEDIYQFQTWFTDPDTGQRADLQMAPYVAGAALRKDFPQIESQAYVLTARPVALKDGQAYRIDDGKFADDNFFETVRLPFQAGNPLTALSRAGNVVLSDAEATRLFGGAAAAMGKTLTLVSAGVTMDFQVTGVLAPLRRDSHMRFTVVARVDLRSFWPGDPDFLNNYGWQSGWIYSRMRPGTDIAQINAQMPAFEKRNIPDQDFAGRRVNQGDFNDHKFVNVRDVHLGEAQDGAQTPGNDLRTIVTFAIVALLILGMACVNFTNLATARASQRAREVALRKVLGADRRQLIVQFLCESVIVAAIAMLIALAGVELALPYVSRFLDADLDLTYVGDGGLLLPILALVLLVGIAGGAYPAFFLSRFQPARVLKANKSAADAEGSGRLRNLLVVAQFAVSIGLIVCTAVVYGQTVYARTSDPGYKRDGLIQIEAVSRRQAWPMMQTFTNELARLPGVAAVGSTGIGIATGNNTNNGVQLPGRDKPVNLGSYAVDEGFFHVMGIRTVAGRIFDRNRPADDATTPIPEDPAAERALIARGVNLVANELAVKRMGFPSPQAAVGKTVKVGAPERFGGTMPATIIGVVSDARFRSIREPIDPILFRLNTTGHTAMLVRYSDPDPAAVNARIERLWKRIFPDIPYDGAFSEDIVGRLYATEAARATMFAAFAVLAVIVGCLGLFGLAAFTAERRTKEIGIRKVLGARTRDIVRLLVWQFSQPVLLANLIAWPVAWWVMRGWLNGFDQRIALGPTPFLLAGLLALAIAIGTIAGHATRVARASPVKALRYE